MKHKDSDGSAASSLPTYDGEGLDSWLLEPIVALVQELYIEFFNEHADIRGKVMLERLKNNPTAYKLVGQPFVASLRESGETSDKRNEQSTSAPHF